MSFLENCLLLVETLKHNLDKDREGGLLFNNNKFQLAKLCVRKEQGS